MIRGENVSVVIPTIPGREELLQRAVRSVQTQQVRPAMLELELDVDRTGAAATRNRALERVNTPWVAFLDDDDEWLPNHLKVLLRAANNPALRPDLVFSYAEFVGGRDPLACCSNGQLIAEPINVAFGTAQADHLRSDRRARCMHCGYECGNFIPCCYLVRTDAIRAVGGFPEPYSMPEVRSGGDCEDYLCLLKMLDNGARFYHVPGVRTWRYYFHGANTGGRGADRLHELERTEP
jgi:glycosyltransferase involved in cell wall biosynthesis